MCWRRRDVLRAPARRPRAMAKPRVGMGTGSAWSSPPAWPPGDAQAARAYRHNCSLLNVSVMKRSCFCPPSNLKCCPNRQALMASLIFRFTLLYYSSIIIIVLPPFSIPFLPAKPSLPLHRPILRAIALSKPPAEIPPARQVPWFSVQNFEPGLNQKTIPKLRMQILGTLARKCNILIILLIVSFSFLLVPPGSRPMFIM